MCYMVYVMISYTLPLHSHMMYMVYVMTYYTLPLHSVHVVHGVCDELADPDDLFDPVVARNSEVLGLNLGC